MDIAPGTVVLIILVLAYVFREEIRSGQAAKLFVAVAVAAWIAFGLFGWGWFIVAAFTDDDTSVGGYVVAAVVWPAVIFGVPLNLWEKEQRKRGR